MGRRSLAAAWWLEDSVMANFRVDREARAGIRPAPPTLGCSLRGAEKKLAYPVSPGIEEMVEPELCPVPGWATGDRDWNVTPGRGWGGWARG